MHRSIVFAFALIALCGQAAADESLAAQGAAHYKAAIAEYAAKDYEAAITDFRASYTYDPRPEVLYAWAQAERLSGDCPSAIVLYRKFLEGDPAAEQAEAARANLHRCTEALATRPVEEAPTPAPPPPRPVVAPPPVTHAAPRPHGPHLTWWKDPLGDGLAAGGLVALALGAGFLGAADDAQSAADHAASYDAYAHAIDLAGSRRTVAAVAFASGTALVATAVVRWVLVGRRTAESRTVLTIAPSSSSGGGAALSLAGTW